MRTPRMTIIAAAATVVVLFLLIAAVAAASPGKQDKWGCHRCAADCAKYSLEMNEYHCHGNVSVQSQNILQAPRIYGDKTYRRVARIIDGDTLSVYVGGTQKIVRLLGIDAPELQPLDNPGCYSKQATAAITKFAYNKYIVLEKDKIQKDDKDKYGRLLRFITVLGSSVTVNEQLLNNGAAKTYPSLISNIAQYKHDEAVAKASGAGLWGFCSKPKEEPKALAASRLFPLKGERYGRDNIN